MSATNNAARKMVEQTASHLGLDASADAEITTKLTPGQQLQVNAAIDVADHLLVQSLDFARSEISHGVDSIPEVVKLAAAHAHVATMAYALNRLADDLTEAPRMAETFLDPKTGKTRCRFVPAMKAAHGGGHANG